MTLPRLDMLTAYWKDYPPTHVLAAAWMGYKSNTRSKQSDKIELPEFVDLPEFEEGAGH